MSDIRVTLTPRVGVHHLRVNAALMRHYVLVQLAGITVFWFYRLTAHAANRQVGCIPLVSHGGAHGL